MADILDVLIQILNIDCGVAQCYYANPMEGLFYLFFFPTIFIILFIYILTNFIFRGSGKIQGLRILIAVGAYAFIIFERLFTMVVGLSRLWWILTIILVGLYAFIRFLFKGGEEGGSKGAMPDIGKGGLGGTAREIGKLILKKKLQKPLISALGLKDDETKRYDEIWDKYKKNKENMNALDPTEQAIIKLSLSVETGVSDATQINQLKKLLKTEVEE